MDAANTSTPNAIASIGAELSQAQQLVDEVPTEVGMLSIKTANQTIVEASTRPNPIPLWMTLWYEGEVCCLFADSNLGKSIYAVQIATHIALQQRVLYFDFELSEKQFQLRYTNDSTNQLHSFPDNLFRVAIDRERMQMDDFENRLIAEIEQATVRSKCKVIIIDNLSYICITSEKGDCAGNLMMRLMELKRKHELSILVLAHTPKRPLNQPITQNDLAGSKKLINFFDSAFAIGRSAKDESLRYIKQVKVRFGNNEYGADNVMVCNIEKKDAFLQFSPIGFASEFAHLKELTDEDRRKVLSEILSLRSKGLSLRDIGSKLGISKNTVDRMLKKHEKQAAEQLADVSD